MNDPSQMDTSLLNNNGQTSNVDHSHGPDNLYTSNMIESFLSPPPLMNSKEYENNSHSVFFPSHPTKYLVTEHVPIFNSDHVSEAYGTIQSNNEVEPQNHSENDTNIAPLLNSLMPHLNHNTEDQIISNNVLDYQGTQISNNIQDQDNMEIVAQEPIDSNENRSSTTHANTPALNHKDSSNESLQQNGLGVYECIICKNVKSCQYQIPKQPSLDNSIINSDVYICDKQCLTVFINKNLLEVIGQENVEPDNQLNSLPNDENQISGESVLGSTLKQQKIVFKKLCIFCYTSMPDFLSHLYISDDSSKPICPKHLPCQAVQFSIPSCVECGKQLEGGRMVLLDSNLDFCSEHCLSVFLPKLSINCYLCNKILTKEAFGQYCLKLENRNIRQFCGNACLENFNPLATYCYHCHKDITGMANPIVSGTDIYCSRNCLQREEKVSNAHKLQRETGQCPCDICGVCKQNKPIHQNLVCPGHGAPTPTPASLVKICSETCLESFLSSTNNSSQNSIAKFAGPKGGSKSGQSPAANAQKKGGQNSCENCHISMAGRKSMSALTIDGRTHFFCSQNCTESFKESKTKIPTPTEAARPTPGRAPPLGDHALLDCHWCHVTRYVRDMVAVILEDENEENKSGKEAEIKYFCSQNCVSLYKMDQDSESDGRKGACANCGKDGNSQYTLLDPNKGDPHHFCSLPCLTMFKKQMTKSETKRKTTGPRRDTGSTGNASFNKPPAIKNDLAGIKESIKKMAAISKSDRFKVLLDILRAVAGSEDKSTNNNTATAATATPNLVWPVPPRDVKNKSTSIKPLVRSQGTSFQAPNLVHKETQTEKEPGKILPLPIPVPFYVPFPLHMYTSYTPVPLALPVPIVVPTFIPTTYSTAEEISKYIKSIKDKIPSDPLQSELLAIAEMVAENEEMNPDIPVPPDPVRLKPLKGSPGFKPTPESLNPYDESGGHSMTAGGIASTGDEVYQIQFDGDFNASTLANFGGDVTTAIPIQNADGSITYATIDPQTGTLTPIDPLILQQHLQSLHLQQQQQQNQLLQQHGNDATTAPDHSGGGASVVLSSQDEQQKQLLQALIDPSTGAMDLLNHHHSASTRASHPQGGTRGGAGGGGGGASNRIPDFSPPYTFTLEPHQKHMEATYGVGAYKWWVRERNGELALTNSGPYWKDDPLTLTTDELVLSLAMFVKEIKKPNDENYTSDSIYYFCLGIQSSLFDNGRSENVFTDTLYGTFTDSLNEVLLRFEPQITTEGMLLSRIDEECLWESMQLGAHSPHVLLNTLLYFNTKYFHLTTLEAHLSLSFKHVQKVTKLMEDGKSATVLRFYPPGDKTVEEQIEEGVAVYEQAENMENPLRCPVRLYEFYLSKCPDSTRERDDVYYLLPESLCLPNSPLWYCEEPLSPTILAKMFNRIFIVKETLESNIAL